MGKHDVWCYLNLKVPVSGDADPWFDGRGFAVVSQTVNELLANAGGLDGEMNGSMSDANGNLVQVMFQFAYDDLKQAVIAFSTHWTALNLPSGATLTHVEHSRATEIRPRKSVIHLMIESGNDGFEVFHTDLSDENRMT